MAPTATQLSCQLRQVIFYHLDNGFYDNALFLSERLHGLEPRNVEAIYLLAHCHRRLGQNKIAYDYLRPVALKGTHLGCAYVFAQVCFALGKYTDGVAALDKTRALWEGKSNLNKHSETTRRPLPDAAACYCLMGKLLHADNQIKRAVDSYVDALKLNPFMWDAFERLCDTGANIKSSNIFKATPALLSLINYPPPIDLGGQTGDIPVIQDLPIENYNQPFVTGNDPFTTSAAAMDLGRGSGSTAVHQKVNGVTPMMNDVSIETPPQGAYGTRREVSRGRPATESNLEPPNAPNRRSRAVHGLGLKLTSETLKPRMLSPRGTGRSVVEDATTTESGAALPPGHNKRTISGSLPQTNIVNNPAATNAPQRRSRRLFTKPTASSAMAGFREGVDLTKARATGTRGRTAAVSTVGRVVSGNRKPMEGPELPSKEPRPPITSSISEVSTQKVAIYDSAGEFEALRWLLDLLHRFGMGYYAASRYHCQAALQHYQNVPTHQKETPWILAQIGKVLNEDGKYADAGKVFAKLAKKVPARLEDMEVYSTVLWHLKSDTELAFLSHELLDLDRYSPQAWCTIGNSFSLQRDHDQALKCFKRATQLDPKFAYSFTLQGHEYSANEEYTKALQAYRKAISADHRHYNGWYGLARVYEKMGKYNMAEEHYRAAASINPTNAVLVWSIGMVLEKQKKHKAALAQYKHACELAPQSAMPRFKKARILLHLQLFEEALDEFNILKDMVPDESNVHFMLGKVHKQLNNKSEAVKHFTIALNLDPKAAPYIKETMESLDQEGEVDSDDDEEMS